jgi:hypothetical protein
MTGESSTRTAYMVTCPFDGDVYLTPENYRQQMWAANSKWVCPRCGENAYWSDDNYEETTLELQENGR